MDKKRVIIFSILILGLFLIGGLLANGATIILNSGATDLSSLNTTGETNGLVNITDLKSWTRGGGNEFLNISLNVTGGDAGVHTINITNLTSPWGYNFPAIVFFQARSNNTIVNVESHIIWTLLNNRAFNNTFGLMLLPNGSSVMNVSGNGAILNLTFGINVTASTGVERVYTWNVTAHDNRTNNGNLSSTTFVSGIDGSAPRLFVNTTNVSYGTTTRSSNFNADTFVKNNTGFNITVTVTDYNIWKVILVFRNETATNFLNLTLLGNGASLAPLTGGGNHTIPNSVGGANLTGMSYIVMSNKSTQANAGGTGSTAPSYVFNATIRKEHLTRGGQPFDFVFVAFDLYNQSIQLNNSNSVFRVVNDAYNPSVTVTAPSSTTVATSSTTGIIYTCAGTDVPNETISDYLWTLTKPDDTTVTKTTSSATFRTTDIDLAGTYDLTCKVTDGVDHTATSSVYQFSAHVTSTGSGSSSSGGGSGGASSASTTISVDNDLSSEPTAEIAKKQGAIVTISLDGKNSHKITFKQVTTDRVTLVIQSDPIEITLAVEESKEVDVDGDGTNDLKVTLNSITAGVADITTEKIADTTESAPEEEGVTTTTVSDVTGEETTTPLGTEESGRSLTWLWVLIVVIVVVGIYFATKGKKGKK